MSLTVIIARPQKTVNELTEENSSKRIKAAKSGPSLSVFRMSARVQAAAESAARPAV